MRVRIDRQRETRSQKTGWFARHQLPAFCLYITVTFSEEEQYLIGQSGIAALPFFRIPPPPEISDPEELSQLKSENSGQIFIGDLLSFKTQKLFGAWPDAIAVQTAEEALRAKFDELAQNLTRAASERESHVVWEL
jgi:hypothetical protein